jgi:hypothetical protein
LTGMGIMLWPEFRPWRPSCEPLAAPPEPEVLEGLALYYRRWRDWPAGDGTAGETSSGFAPLLARFWVALTAD